MKPRNFDGSRICQGSIGKRERRLDRKEFVEKRSPRVSIDSNLSRICREAVELDKKQFFKERKNTQK